MIVVSFSGAPFLSASLSFSHCCFYLTVWFIHFSTFAHFVMRRQCVSSVLVNSLFMLSSYNVDFDVLFIIERKEYVAESFMATEKLWTGHAMCVNVCGSLNVPCPHICRIAFKFLFFSPKSSLKCTNYISVLSPEFKRNEYQKFPFFVFGQSYHFCVAFDIACYNIACLLCDQNNENGNVEINSIAASSAPFALVLPFVQLFTRYNLHWRLFLKNKKSIRCQIHDEIF